MKVSIIVATGKNLEIGLENKLLWSNSEDLKNFKKITTGHYILMGRKTFESIGRPLPNRNNLILTRDLDYKREGVTVFNDPLMVFDHVLSFENENLNELELFIIGGEEIYQLFLPYVQKIYQSLIDFEGKADAFFPKLNPLEWELVNSEKFETFVLNTYERV